MLDPTRHRHTMLFGKNEASVDPSALCFRACKDPVVEVGSYIAHGQRNGGDGCEDVLGTHRIR